MVEHISSKEFSHPISLGLCEDEKGGIAFLIL